MSCLFGGYKFASDLRCVGLVYVNFQQNFPYFSSHDKFYCINISLPTAYFTSSRCVLKHGFPKFGLFFLKRPAGFHCRKRPSPTFANIWSHCPWALQSTAPVISQVEEYFGRDGILSNAPFINLTTSGWDPKVTAEGSKITVDKALLAVFNAL